MAVLVRDIGFGALPRGVRHLLGLLPLVKGFVQTDALSPTSPHVASIFALFQDPVWVEPRTDPHRAKRGPMMRDERAHGSEVLGSEGQGVSPSTKAITRSASRFICGKKRVIARRRVQS